MIHTIRQRRHLVKTCPDTNHAVLLDHRTCDTRYPFAYTLYTKEQNALMHKYRGVFRFMADTRDDLADAARTLDPLLNSDFSEDQIHFVGRQALDRVILYFPVIDINGRDYMASDLQ